MQLGGFGFIKDYDEIKKAGFDYAELDMPEIEQLGGREFDTFRQHVDEAEFPIPNGARILPITEPLFFRTDFKVTNLESYLKSSCRKSSQLGIRQILFGNGKARQLLDEDSIKRENIFIQFLRMLCEIAGENGQDILIEPLGPKYSNYINTLSQAAEVIAKADMPNLFAMADLRHFVWSKEPFEDIVKYRELVHHVHIDYPISYPERKYPNVKDDYDYAPFFDQLKGYDGTITIEADVPSDWMRAGADARELLEVYRK